ncbi:Dethiobiotin synthetase [hydrothermal vent metagenome]|uniref:Dethiobiotin synthetase n=1 Tax=hydrothermal vent metagenome TaxID=652676 RepID=A0A1W1C167_9ZZZZ
MHTIFITATNTNIGKTYTTTKLINEFSKRGLRVCAIKPIETGVDTLPQDGTKVLQQLQKYPQNPKLTLHEVVPIMFKQPAAPFIASEKRELDLQIVFDTVLSLRSLCDVLLIEGAGGLFVPINKEYFMINFIKDLEVDRTLLVTHCALGCINDTLLSQKALTDANLNFITAFNCRDDDTFEQTSKPFFDTINQKIMIVDKDIEALADALLKI